MVRGVIFFNTNYVPWLKKGWAVGNQQDQLLQFQQLATRWQGGQSLMMQSTTEFRVTMKARCKQSKKVAARQGPSFQQFNIKVPACDIDRGGDNKAASESVTTQ